MVQEVGEVFAKRMEKQFRWISLNFIELFSASFASDLSFGNFAECKLLTCNFQPSNLQAPSRRCYIVAREKVDHIRANFTRRIMAEASRMNRSDLQRL